MMTSSNGNIFRVTGHSPYKGQWRGALMFSLICVWINGWVNSEAGDLRWYRAHYDVTVMCLLTVIQYSVMYIQWNITSQELSTLSSVYLITFGTGHCFSCKLFNVIWTSLSIWLFRPLCWWHLKRFKDMVEVGHHLRNRPQTHLHFWWNIMGFISY